MPTRTTFSFPRLAAADELMLAPPAPGISIPRPLEGIRLDIDPIRLVNVAAALLLLVLAAPVMAVIALLVKLTSPGPVVFRQVRVGVDRRSPGSGSRWRRTYDYGGRLFTMYKFRTMSAASDDRLQVWAQPDDPRVTALGRVLRKYRLDELPQLVNVLRGDMNLVGPRPEQPRIFAELRDQVDRYAERQRVLPGITGWAQVQQPYDRSVDDVRGKVRLDLEYIATRSVRRDVQILMRTVPAVLLRRGGW
ncbi:sugar transferase [Longimicrobium sp.]|uniref:sugar transferase n=1 Tax=Longimicrobium sp. TaxID=2029185 RepID=UPI002C544A28|nr:sugar transferase [Longimicrobium sp.]HSU13074.1 sugar transferase [Longimicrobium sp.]